MIQLRQLFLMCLLTMVGTGAFAYDFEVGGICYNILDAVAKTVEVTYQNGEQPSSESNNCGYEISEAKIPATVTNGTDTYVVTSIGERAFYRCKTLTSVSLPDGITSIGDYAFYYCTNMENISIANGVTSIGKTVFYGCTSLTEISLPASVTTIGISVFYGCSNLTSVNVPNGVTSIEDNTFHGCKVLTNVNIPNGVTSIGKSAFEECEALVELDIPGSVATIKEAAFRDCRALTKVEIPNGVTIVDGFTFQNCMSLSEVIIPATVTSIHASAFLHCESLAIVTIPNGVTSIASNAFWGCSALAKVEIPSSVTSLNGNIFKSCGALEEIVVDEGNSTYYSDGSNAIIQKSTKELITGCKNTIIPEDVKSIGKEAFYECASLTEINIPGNVTTIGEGAFEYCSNLAEIVIPSTVTSIGSMAFFGCNAMKKVICFSATPPTCGSNAFLGVSPICVPQDYVDTYKTNWSSYKNNIKGTIPILVGSTGYATYCSHADLDFTGVEGVKAYVASEYVDGSVTLEPVTNVPAGTGILLIGTPETYEIPFVLTDESIEDNLLKGTLTATELPQTTTIDDVDYTNYVLGNKNDEVGFYKSSGTGNIAAHKAYLQLPAKVGVSGVRLVIDDGHVTGIEVTTRQERAPQDGAVYNLSGQCVEKPQRGLYIVNGKKVVLR